MATPLTNLLPPSRAKAIRRTYFVRLATLALLMLSVLVVIHGLLLIPSYLFLNKEVSVKTQELAFLATSLQSSEEQKIQTELSSLQTKATTLSALSSVPTASSALRALLAVSRTGITLTGFTYTPPVTGTPGSMQVAGTADTREDLRSYDQALGSLPFITSADLPISDYASESDINFTITLTGSFKS